MSVYDLKRRAENLESLIATSGLNKRLRLQPEFSMVLQRLRDQGEHVTPRLRNLDELLTDEVMESRFDNMPV